MLWREVVQSWFHVDLQSKFALENNSMEILLGSITRRIDVIYESPMKWKWHHTKLAVEEISFFGRLRVVLLGLLLMHDGAVGVMNLGAIPLCSWLTHRRIDTRTNRRDQRRPKLKSGKKKSTKSKCMARRFYTHHSVLRILLRCLFKWMHKVRSNFIWFCTKGIHSVRKVYIQYERYTFQPKQYPAQTIQACFNTIRLQT